MTGFRRFQFIDDQITGKHKFAKELFRALEPLKIKFSCLWTVNSNHDDELLELAAKAGVFHAGLDVAATFRNAIAGESPNRFVDGPLARSIMFPG